MQMNEISSKVNDKYKGGLKLTKSKNRARKLSYESDGKMGNQKQSENNKKEQVDFFNTTQDSE